MSIAADEVTPAASNRTNGHRSAWVLGFGFVIAMIFAVCLIVLLSARDAHGASAHVSRSIPGLSDLLERNPLEPDPLEPDPLEPKVIQTKVIERVSDSLSPATESLGTAGAPLDSMLAPIGSSLSEALPLPVAPPAVPSVIDVLARPVKQVLGPVVAPVVGVVGPVLDVVAPVVGVVGPVLDTVGAVVAVVDPEFDPRLAPTADDPHFPMGAPRPASPPVGQRATAHVPSGAEPSVPVPAPFASAATIAWSPATTADALSPVLEASPPAPVDHPGPSVPRDMASTSTTAAFTRALDGGQSMLLFAVVGGMLLLLAPSNRRALAIIGATRRSAFLSLVARPG